MGKLASSAAVAVVLLGFSSGRASGAGSDVDATLDTAPAHVGRLSIDAPDDARRRIVGAIQTSPTLAARLDALAAIGASTAIRGRVVPPAAGAMRGPTPANLDAIARVLQAAAIADLE